MSKQGGTIKDGGKQRVEEEGCSSNVLLDKIECHFKHVPERPGKSLSIQGYSGA